MLYLYGDESNTPGADKIWAVGFLFTTNPTVHMQVVQQVYRRDSKNRAKDKLFTGVSNMIQCADFFTGLILVFYWKTKMPHWVNPPAEAEDRLNEDLDNRSIPP